MKILVPFMLMFPALLASFSCPQSGASIQATGTVHYVDLEGGFYGIETDDGLHYRPLDLPTRFQKDGIRIRFCGRAVQGVIGIQMWGIPVEVSEVEPVEPRRDTH